MSVSSHCKASRSSGNT
uniref:Uncharacterized protein n=1 Tax=Anguilla anguilla TaxID=7936 RepID=A0A0E9TUS1_ANGAN